MYFISKGIPEKGGVSEALRIVTGGQVCTLFGLDEQLWLLGHRNIAKTTSREQEEAVQRLQQSGLAEYTTREYPTAPYMILIRCLIVPCKPGKRNALTKQEKIVLTWIREAGFRLSMAELVYLYENRIRPAKYLLGEDNRQALADILYPDGKIETNELETKMETSRERKTVVDAVISLMQKKRVVFL